MARKIKVDKDKVLFTDNTVLKHKDRSLDMRKLFSEGIYDLVTEGKVDTDCGIREPLMGWWKNIKKADNANSWNFKTFKELVYDAQDYLDGIKEGDVGYITYLLDKELFTWQKELLQDENKKITLLCGRRSGKSYGLNGVAVRHCLQGYDDVTDITTGTVSRKPRKVLIMGLTHGRTVEVFWSNLTTFALLTKMVQTIDNSTNTVIFNNGATIQLYGNASKAEREKLRGSEYSLIIIDECQSQQSLQYVMRDILGPIAKGRDSTFILAGTGSISEKSYWKDITESPNWRHYNYTMADNPTIPNRETALKQVLVDNAWTEDDPTYQREYLGRNVIDITRVVIPKRNYIEDTNTPFTAIACVIGVDYGVQDYNALVPILKDANGNMRIVHEQKFNLASASEIVDKMAELERYIKETYKCSVEFVADTSDQAISKDLRRKGARIHNAYKVDKKLQLSELAFACRSGKLLCSKDGEFEDECKQAIWDYDIETNTVIYEFDDSFHPDAIPAAQYAYHYLTTGKHSRTDI